MTNDELIAASETAYELVASYARDLQEFIDSLESEASAVQSALQTMHNYWDGALYDDFAKNIRSKLDKIANELARAEELRTTLDQSSNDLREVIEVLQAASEG